MSLAYRLTLSPALTNELRGGFLLSSIQFIDGSKYPAYELATSGLLFTIGEHVSEQRPSDQQLQHSGQCQLGEGQTRWPSATTELLLSHRSLQRCRYPSHLHAGVGFPQYTLTSTDLPGASTTNLSTANELYADLAGYVSSAKQTFNVTSPTSGYVPGATNLRRLSYDTFAGYVHDNWKALPHLTVTLGLRYEIWTPVTERSSLFLTPNSKTATSSRPCSTPRRSCIFPAAHPLRSTRPIKTISPPTPASPGIPRAGGKPPFAGGIWLHSPTTTPLRRSTIFHLSPPDFPPPPPSRPATIWPHWRVRSPSRHLPSRSPARCCRTIY